LWSTGRSLIESWNKGMFSTTILLLYFEDFLSLLLFSVLWWNNGWVRRFMIISSVAVLLLCIRPIDHAGGLCMSPILLYRENWVRIVLFVSKTGWCCVCGFRVNSLKFICTVCLVVCKHIRSECNKFRKCLIEQDRKVKLLEVELLVSSEMLFLF